MVKNKEFDSHRRKVLLKYLVRPKMPSLFHVLGALFAMNHIKSMKIRGLKKFSNLQVEFNPRMNILVGENEAGKSTILEAIKIVVNQQYKNSDRSVLMDLFNVDQIKKFKENPCVETLPSILIEIELELDQKNNRNSYFYGEEHTQKDSGDLFGITFTCKYDENIDPNVEEVIRKKEIPCEYYVMSWTTFANRPYQASWKPFNLLAIDTSSASANSSFNYYNRTLFASKFDNLTRMKAKNSFRSKLEAAFEELDLKAIDETRKFGIEQKKIILESAISVFEGAIALENRGSGMENLIKTKIALKKENNVDVVLIEEPETHLSISNLQKMLSEIEAEKENSQMIITTHNNLIASRLRLNNILWIGKEEVKQFKDLERKVSDFFAKADDNSFLHLLLSEKVFLVEGAAEYMLLPWMYEKKIGRKMEDDGLAIISCNGITYQNYLKVAKDLNKKLAIITDNDGDESKIENARRENEKISPHKIFMPESTDDWTFEVSLYNRNKDKLDKFIKTKAGSKYPYKGREIGTVQLRKMLRDKVETAYDLVSQEVELVIPEYIEEAIEWLRK